MAKSKSKSKSDLCSRSKRNVRDKTMADTKKERAKEIKKTKIEMKKSAVKSTLAVLKKIDPMNNNNKNKNMKKTKIESSNSLKESRSKSKELSHKLPSEALKETGMVTRKKNRQVRQETPLTVESTSTASSIQK